MPGVGESPVSPFDVVDDPAFLSLEAWNQFDDQQPRLYLNYLLYDNHFNLVDFGFDQVSEAARIPEDTTLLAGHAFEKLMMEVVAEQAGFIYIYVSNENDQNVTAYFDDLGVEHTYGNIAVATDLYPFGLAMAGRELERIKWRYGYQGDFAEEDEETGWNSFELRMYDAVIVRWTTIDPKRQHFSPYLSMGNNPISKLDADGGDDYHFDKNGNYTGQITERSWLFELFFGHRGIVAGDDGYKFRFADQVNDPANLVVATNEVDQMIALSENPNALWKVELISSETINGLLSKSGSLDPVNQKFPQNFKFARNNSDGIHDGLDFVNYSFIRNRSGTLFSVQLPDGSFSGHNPWNFGNFLWGAAMQKLNIGYHSAVLGAQYHARFLSKWKQWDTEDDQISIYDGYHWSLGRIVKY